MAQPQKMPKSGTIKVTNEVPVGPQGGQQAVIEDVGNTGTQHADDQHRGYHAPGRPWGGPWLLRTMAGSSQAAPKATCPNEAVSGPWPNTRRRA